MNQNIKINYVRPLDSKLFTGHYYDFMLYKGEVNYQSEFDLDNLAIADFSTFNIISGILYSTVLWSGATNNGVDMQDIGFTGMDNGLIHFQKDKISNEQFLELYLNSEYIIPSGDTRLFMTPVTGNTKEYKYPMFLTTNASGETYISCQGGFYQGFFKLDGFEYQVLPNKLDNEWMMHFEVRPRSDYEIGTETVNHLHPENSGIFFFMGTRAENKFWPFYKTESGKTFATKKGSAFAEEYFADSGSEYTLNKENLINGGEWLRDELNPPVRPVVQKDSYFAIGSDYIAYDSNEDIDKGYSSETPTIIEIKQDKPLSKNFLNTYDYNEISNCQCPQPTIIEPEEPEEECFDSCGTYIAHKCPKKWTCPETKKAIVEEYFSSAHTDINMSGYTDSEGHLFGERGYYEIETDNKFVMFDRTKNGVTVDTYEEGMSVILTGKKYLCDANLFLLMNKTCTGYTISTINQYLETNAEDYSVYKDIRGNVFALRIREDGAIGYRYGVLDCSEDNDSRYKIEEEYSKPNLVSPDKWNSINVRFSVLNPAFHKCDNRRRVMRISIYVNGFLVFISKELDALMFKSLDEVSQKQEAVPYNISLGGGSIGLLETILPNYYAIPEYILPIEKDFCGTFVGDIKSFKMYNGFVDYSAIRNYLS